MAALGVLLRITLILPLATVAVIVVLENFQLLPDRLIDIAYGLAIAVLIATFGRAVATACSRPTRPSGG